MKAICLVLDKRLDYFTDYIKPEFKKRLGIEVERFLVGKERLRIYPSYDYTDEDILPIKFDKSTTYPTWFKTPNAYNAWKSHHAIFTKVIQSGDPYFLLLEDDVFIESDFEQILGSNLDELIKTVDFDMLYLGSYNAMKYGTLITPNLVRLPRSSGVGGFHAVILKQNVIKRLLELAPYGPYDYMASKWIHGQLYSCLAVHPSVITQKSGFSYVEGKFLEKPDRTL